MKRLILITILALCAVPPLAAAHAEDPAEAFQGFCEHWMESLAAREQRNANGIKWESHVDGVWGTYIGYAQGHTCTTKTGTQSVPVGKIDYREVVYERHGPSVPEAEHNPPRVLEQTEVTEIFRYSGGQWIY